MRPETAVKWEMKRTKGDEISMESLWTTTRFDPFALRSHSKVGATRKMIPIWEFQWNQKLFWQRSSLGKTSLCKFSWNSLRDQYFWILTEWTYICRSTGVVSAKYHSKRSHALHKALDDWCPIVTLILYCSHLISYF